MKKILIFVVFSLVGSALWVGYTNTKAVKNEEKPKSLFFC